MENKQIIGFAKHVTPLPIEVQQTKNADKIVLYGQNNLYPNFLLELYENSPMHQGIIGDKLFYILGEGVTEKATGKAFNPDVNSVEKLDEFSQKVLLDYLIFGYFGVEVVYNLLGDPIEYIHIPAHQIRANRSLTLFNVCDDWFGNSRNVLSYERVKKGKSEDKKSKIFFYKKYTPSVQNVYPKPEYFSAIKSIETDLAIRNFHLNNINNGFSVSSLITFYGATLTPELKSSFNKKIESAYAGTNGAKFIIDYQNPDGKPAEVTNIGSNDWDKAYQLVKDSVNADILIAHTMPSILFGQNEEGKLGGSGVELETAYQKFLKIYVNGKRTEIETALNKLFDGVYPTIEFKPQSSLFSTSIADTTREKILTIDELRELDGKQPLANNAGNKLIAEPAPVNSFCKHSFNEDEKGEYFQLSAEDFEKVKDLGICKADFEVIQKSEAIENFNQINLIENKFDNDDAVNSYLIEKDLNGKTIKGIRTSIKKDLAIDVTISEIGEKLQKLNSSGIMTIKITDGVITETAPKQPKVKDAKADTPKRQVEVLYSYEGVKDDRNRAFCAKILETDRFYSRQEIQSMTGLFGYDIFKYRGGWYHNPNTGDTTPFCRHRWFANQVIKKEK